MSKFTIAEKGSVIANLVIDGDGDLTLELNGEAILYIKEDGTVCFFIDVLERGKSDVGTNTEVKLNKEYLYWK